MLFENNYYEYPYIPKEIQENYDDFFKGNMFDNEYEGYKNYKIEKYIPKDDKEKDILTIMKYSFAINDYTLYLDIHPEDKSILNKYKETTKKLKEKVELYEKKYGPLTLDNASYETYKWVESPWPWDREDGKYV